MIRALSRISTTISRLKSFWSTERDYIVLSNGLVACLCRRRNGQLLSVQLLRDKTRVRLPGDSNNGSLRVPISEQGLRGVTDIAIGKRFEFDLLGERWLLRDDSDIVTVSYETDGFSLTRSELAEVLRIVSAAMPSNKEGT
jgi:hypothetical protein